MESDIKYSIKVDKNLKLIKEKLIEYLYWIFVVSMWIVFSLSAIQAFQKSELTTLYIHASVVLVFLFTFIIRNKLSFKVRSFILLFILYATSQISLITYGINSQGSVLLLLFIAISAVLYNKQSTIIIYLGSLASIVADYLLTINIQKIFGASNPNVEQEILAWLIGFSIYSIAAFVVAFNWFKLLGYLIKFMAKDLNGDLNLSKANEMLKQEIESRKNTEAILIEQISDFEKLNKDINSTNEALEKTNTLLSEAKKQAQAANDLKASFLSNISHEIRTPLNAIIGFSSMLTNDLAKDDMQKYIDIIQSSSNNLTYLISDIVDISKIESNQFLLYPETVNICKLIEEIEDNYTREIFILKEDNVSFHTETSFTAGYKLIIDKESFKKITNKLLDNAIKFTEHGSINLSFSLKENHILVVSVKDTGIGIAKEKAQLIFENFNQADVKNTRKYGGTGIGLSITKGLVNLLNGKISFHSEPDVGSEFIVEIPIVPNNELVKTKNDHISVNWKGKTILIVGKNIRDNQEIFNLLQQAKCFLLYVDTGLQAIDACQQHSEINLILVDHSLPDMQSNNAAQMIKQYIFSPLLIHTPLIRLTSNDDKSIWNDIINYNITGAELQILLNKYLCPGE